MSDPDVAAMEGSTTLPAAGWPVDAALLPALALVADGEFPPEVTL